MDPVTIALIAGGTKAASGIMSSIGNYREAQEQARRAERAARFARSDARADLAHQTAQIQAEEQGFRLEATVAQRQHELQEQDIAARAIEEQGMAMVGQGMRGVGGAGTQRSMMRQFGAHGRGFQGLQLDRLATFGRTRQAQQMIDIQRERTLDLTERVGRDTRAMERDAQWTQRNAAQALTLGIGGSILGGAATAVTGAYEAGAFTTDAGAGARGAGAPPRSPAPRSVSGFRAVTEQDRHWNPQYFQFL